MQPPRVSRAGPGRTSNAWSAGGERARALPRARPALRRRALRREPRHTRIAVDVSRPTYEGQRDRCTRGLVKIQGAVDREPFTGALTAHGDGTYSLCSPSRSARCARRRAASRRGRPRDRQAIPVGAITTLSMSPWPCQLTELRIRQPSRSSAASVLCTCASERALTPARAASRSE